MTGDLIYGFALSNHSSQGGVRKERRRTGRICFLFDRVIIVAGDDLAVLVAIFDGKAAWFMPQKDVADLFHQRRVLPFFTVGRI